jgi:hypothetical protein
VQKDFRTTQFRGSTDQALVVYFAYPHCLRVLDPKIDPTIPRPLAMPVELKAAAGLSNLATISPHPENPAHLPNDLFKAPPDENSWCYFYEKADLARQEGDYKKIVALGDQASSLGLEANTTWELIPFLEGYARAGEWEQAQNLSLDAYRSPRESKVVTGEILCQTWGRISGELPEGDDLQPGIAELLTKLDCPAKNP